MKYNRKGKKVSAIEAWSNRANLGFAPRSFLESIAQDEKMDPIMRKWAADTIASHDNPPDCNYY